MDFKILLNYTSLMERGVASGFSHTNTGKNSVVNQLKKPNTFSKTEGGLIEERLQSKRGKILIVDHSESLERLLTRVNGKKTNDITVLKTDSSEEAIKIFSSDEDINIVLINKETSRKDLKACLDAIRKDENILELDSLEDSGVEEALMAMMDGPTDNVQTYYEKNSFSTILQSLKKELNFQHTEKEKIILMAGCNPDIVPEPSKETKKWSKLAGLCEAFGWDIHHASAVTGIINKVKSKPPPDVIVLGPHVKSSNSGEMANLIDILKKIRELNRNTKLILIYDPCDADKAINVADNKTYIVDSMRADNLEFIFRRIKDFYRREWQKTVFKPRIFSINENKKTVMTAQEIILAKKAMREFSEVYDDHMDMTGHYPAMLMIMNTFSQHFGNVILDVACGTGKSMRRFIRNSIITRMKSGKRDEPMLIHSIDAEWKMLAQAQAGFYNRLLVSEEKNLQGRMGMTFIETDFLDLTIDWMRKHVDPKGSGMRGDYLEDIDPFRLDTVLISYFIYWTPDKEKTVESLSNIMPKKGCLITMEEPNLRVSPGALDSETAETIITAPKVIPLQDYYDMLQDYGFIPVENRPPESPSDLTQPIKGNPEHIVRGKVFYKS